jgi:hypothetical protein
MRQHQLLFIFVALCFSSLAQAGLGDDITTSIDNDSAKLQASHKVLSTTSKYTVHQLEYTGTRVREYVGPDGKIFGVAWDGFTHPDMQVVLGQFYPEYKAALEKAKSNRKFLNRRFISFKSENLSVTFGGRPRRLFGSISSNSRPTDVSQREVK